MFLQQFNQPKNEPVEIEIMIAEPSMRRRGLGRLGILCMIRYCFETLGYSVFEVKILEKNTASIELFKSIGFRKVKHVPVFEQVDFQLTISESSDVADEEEGRRSYRWLLERTAGYRTSQYDPVS